jgi:hypothetical protein
MDPSFSTFAPGDQSYRDNWDRIFGKKDAKPEEETHNASAAAFAKSTGLSGVEVAQARIGDVDAEGVLHVPDCACRLRIKTGHLAGCPYDPAALAACDTPSEHGYACHCPNQGEYMGPTAGVTPIARPAMTPEQGWAFLQNPPSPYAADRPSVACSACGATYDGDDDTPGVCCHVAAPSSGKEKGPEPKSEPVECDDCHTVVPRSQCHASCAECRVRLDRY